MQGKGKGSGEKTEEGKRSIWTRKEETGGEDEGHRFNMESEGVGRGVLMGPISLEPTAPSHPPAN